MASTSPSAAASMNRMIGRLRHDSSASLSFLFEHLRDLLVAAFSRHLDQVAIVQAVRLGIRTGVEQEAHGFEVSFARRKVHGRRVPVFRSSETRIAFEQPSQGRDVTGGRGDDGVPRVAAACGFEFDRFDHRAPPGDALDKRLELGPAVEAVARAPARVARRAGRTSPRPRRDSARATSATASAFAGAKRLEQFLGLALELIEIGMLAQRASRQSVRSQ